MIEECSRGFSKRRKKPKAVTRTGAVGQVEIHQGDTVIADARPDSEFKVVSVAKSGVPTVAGRRYVPAGWQVTVRCSHQKPPVCAKNEVPSHRRLF